ncbi:MAG: transposase [Planctomycetota bacterium]
MNNGTMALSAPGQLVQSAWEDLPTHHRHVELDAFVVMPNHVHGIIVLRDGGTAGRAPTETPPAFGKPQHGDLSTIVRSFKATVTKELNRRHGTLGAPLWQRNYYEHVIRNAKEWDALRQYIAANPAQWPLDSENPDRQVDDAPPRTSSP